MRCLLTLPLAVLLLAVAFSAPSLVTARPPAAPLGHELTFAYTFDMYCEDHGKAYRPASAEYAMRKANFDANLEEIITHNRNAKRSFTMGVNKYSDWSKQEFKSILGARREPKHVANPKIEKPYLAASSKPIASTLDYRKAVPAVLSAVKDQGQCGDCWAHAVTEAIESAYAMKTGQLLVLSQQQITSCTPAQGSCYGCDGMYPKYAYEYAASTQYVLEEWIYPFESYWGNNIECLNMTQPVYPLQNFVSLEGYMQIAPNRQDLVVAALNELGPLSILVNAMPFMNYESGVFDNCTYDKNFYLDHAVLLVGYGYDADLDKDYWIVRNSWTAQWGEHGYIRIEKTVVPTCGMDMGGMSCFSDGNTTQPEPTCGMCGVIVDAQFPMVLS